MYVNRNSNTSIISVSQGNACKTKMVIRSIEVSLLTAITRVNFTGEEKNATHMMSGNNSGMEGSCTYVDIYLG